jgi:endoglucanase
VSAARRRLSGLLIATMAAAFLLVPGAQAAEARAASSSASTAPVPVVSGTSILDSRTGDPWLAHAVNWPSFEYACQQGWGESASGTTAAAAAAMVAWGITAVRIPLNQDCWLGVDGAPAIGTPATYKAAISAWVSTLNQAGLVVILDLHWTAPSGSIANGQRAMPDAQSVTFWSQLATAYRTSGSVLFETFNEPYSRGSFALTWSCWRDGGCVVPSSNDQSALGTATYTAHGQAEIVSAIRAAGAAQPILLDGLDYANDLRGWLANRPNDSQLIASWHNYPGQRCQSSSCWNAEILPVAASVPVIATEFGETDGGSAFLTGFMTWADAHLSGYAPWAWWVTDASDGTEANLYALISDLSSFSPRAPSGTAFHDHLASLPSPTSDSVPIFRFWAPQKATHFSTASVQERDGIIASYPPSVWSYEGIAYRAFLGQHAGTVPLYRFWSPLLSSHFYTADPAEKAGIIANYPASTWTYEGIAYYVYPTDTTAAGTIAVSRFWSPSSRHHFYTASIAERDAVIAGYPPSIWSYEGETFRVPVN